jgi:hypothetical protein
MAKSITWREALLAMAQDARTRAQNSVPMRSGPNDPVTVAEKSGARFAFNVMADELEYMAADWNKRDALTKMRRLLDKRQNEKSLAYQLENEDEDGSPLDGDNDPDA